LGLLPVAQGGVVEVEALFSHAAPRADSRRGTRRRASARPPVAPKVRRF
jgi:hypothetical protein